MTSIGAYIRWVLLGGLAVANAFIWSAALAEERGNVLTIAFLDVGQGDAIFIESPSGNQLLVDGGSGTAVLQDLGSILPAHDRSIDVVVATHPDADHIGGLSEVLARYNVSYIVRSGAVNDTAVYRAFNDAVANESDARVLRARRGMRIDLGKEVRFDILFPDRDVSGIDPNDASIVGRLVYGETEVLLTGDAPKSVERYIVSLDETELASDILKIGHHGSKTSSAESFIGFVSPRYSIISAACDSRYGHPHQDVLDTLARFDTDVLGTCEEGTIAFETDGAVLRRK